MSILLLKSVISAIMALMAIFKMLLGVEHGIEEAVFII
jgi:hypothetical protein